jgi:hypothetical protein
MHLVNLLIEHMKHNPIYKDESFLLCLFVCLFVPYTNSHFCTKLCIHLPLGLEETVGYVWTQDVCHF